MTPEPELPAFKQLLTVIVPAPAFIIFKTTPQVIVPPLVVLSVHVAALPADKIEIGDAAVLVKLKAVPDNVVVDPD